MSPFDTPKAQAAEAANVPPQFPLGMNARGLWTLYLKEVRRFINVYTQTIAAPIATTLLFLAIFTLALGRGAQVIDGVPYAEFLAGGLIIMAMVQNAFANTSSSIVIAKVQGNIVDVLMPPLSALELTLGFALAGMTRGLVVGVAVALGMLPFVTLHLHSPLLVLFHGAMGSLMLALLGVIGALWSEKFDHIAAVTNFVITPLSFLSGTFYSINRLPEFWHFIAYLNPFFYMIDGFRYGMIGHADGDLGIGMLVLAGSNLLLALTTWRLFAIGYKIKS